MTELTVAAGSMDADDRVGVPEPVRSDLNLLTGDYIVVQGEQGRESLKLWLPPHDLSNDELLLPDEVCDALGVTTGDTVTIAPVTPNNSGSVDVSAELNTLNDESSAEAASTTGSTDTEADTASSTDTPDTAGDADTNTGTETVATGVTYDDIGGLGDELDQIRETVELPLSNPDLFADLGIDPPKGVLMHGPPGTGKTLIAKAVATQTDAEFFHISGPEIMSKYKGESEARLRDIFEQARAADTAIIFFDEIDSLAGERDDDGGAENRLVGQLLSLMDGCDTTDDVVVIGATNRVDTLDPALRRGGRFDRELEIGVPDQTGREEILHIHTRDMPVADDVNIQQIAERTHGFVGADLAALCREAALHAIGRHRGEDANLTITTDIAVTRSDFERALGAVEPSAMREFVAESPTTTFDDVGGLDDEKRTLKQSVEWPLQHTALFEATDTDPPTGILLYGPSGTGKTLLVRALAGETDVNFLHIEGPELVNKYVGESEEAVRDVFDRARQAAPAIVFLDEIDAVAASRGGGDTGVTDRVVSQLLTELDRAAADPTLTVVAATNRRDALDPALLRPGRFEEELQFNVPSRDERRAIFTVHTRDKPLGSDVDTAIVDDLRGATGADIEAIVRKASMRAIEDAVDEYGSDASARADDVTITRAQFEAAIKDLGWQGSISD